MMIRPAFLVAACGVLLCGMASAQDDAVGAKVEAAKGQYEKAVEKARNGLSAEIKRKADVAQKAGDLATMEKVLAEAKAFEDTGELPKSVSTKTYESQLRTARARLEEAYAAAVRQYTKDGKIALAKAVQQELDEVKKAGALVPVHRFDEAVSITAKSEHGYVIGKVNKGERIMLQYVSGKWKAWGRQATESPDDINAGGNESCRVALCEATATGATSVVTVVRAGTETKPFEWVAEKDYEKLVLRINDSDGDFASNPDGGVRYRLRVLRAK
jgi:hypothetical protein